MTLEAAGHGSRLRQQVSELFFQEEVWAGRYAGLELVLQSFSYGHIRVVCLAGNMGSRCARAPLQTGTIQILNSPLGLYLSVLAAFALV